MSYIKQRKHALASSKLATGVGLGTTLLAGLMAPAAHAASDSPSSGITLPEITVNAKKQSTVSDYKEDFRGTAKFTQPVAKTPQTVQVIGQALIQDQHATTLTAALKNSPGVGSFYLGENGSTSTGDAIYMRGFDTSGSIFVDGVRDLGAVSRDTFNTEKITVVKGPNGTSFGRTAPSGSINIVTKQAKFGNHLFSTLSVGTADQKRATLDVNRQFSDHSALRVNLMAENSGVPGRDFVRNRRWGIAPAITFGLGTPTRLSFNYQHVSQNNQPDGGVITIGLPGYSSPDPSRPEFGNAPRVDSSNYYGTGSDFEDVTIDRVTAKFEQDISASKFFHNTTRWARIYQAYVLSSFTAKTVDPSWDMNDFSHWLMDPRRINAKDQVNSILTNQSGIVQITSTGSVEHTLSYGLEVTREQVDNRGITADGTIGLGQINIYHPSHAANYYPVTTGISSSGQTDTIALYLFDTMRFIKHVTAKVGLRLDHYTTNYSRTGAADLEAQGNLFTWQLGSIYQINRYGNVYANYALSAQPPGGNKLALSADNGEINNPNLDPQEAKTIELGSKWELMNRRLLLTAAIYRTTVSNQLTQDPVTSEFSQTGEKRVSGVELSASGQISRNWNISAGFTAMQTDSDVAGDKTLADGGSGELAYSPSIAFTSWTSYRLPFGLLLGAGLRYTGQMERGSFLEPGQTPPVGTPDYVEDYWVANAMASYPLSKHMELQLNVYNLADTDYVAAINKSGYRYTPGRPLSAQLSLNITF